MALCTSKEDSISCQTFCSKWRTTFPTTFRILFFKFPKAAWAEERQLYSRQSSTEGSPKGLAPVTAVARTWASLGRSNDRIEFALGGFLLILPPNIPSNYGHKFCGVKREHTKCFLKLVAISHGCAPSGQRWSSLTSLSSCKIFFSVALSININFISIWHSTSINFNFEIVKLICNHPVL